jgi:hypothetical protein
MCCVAHGSFLQLGSRSLRANFQSVKRKSFNKVQRSDDPSAQGALKAAAWPSRVNGRRLRPNLLDSLAFERRRAEGSSVRFGSFAAIFMAQEACVLDPGKQHSSLMSTRHHHHKFLPSITVTGTASRSKSSNSRALTPTFIFSKSALPLDQSGDSEKVPQPQLAQKLCFTVFVRHW